MTPSPGPAIVLTAGLGRRLLPLTYCRAKPAVPVAGTPLICRTLSWLASEGVRDAVLNLHYRPETIAAVVGDGSDLGIRVRYTWEPLILGSAGGPRRALSLLDSPRVLIINGDTLTNVDLNEMVAAHERTSARVTLAVVPSTDPRRYGGVLADKHGRVRGFTRAGHPEPCYHFIGVQVVEAEVFRELPDGRPAATIGGLYSSLVTQDDGALHAHVVSAAFRDIGTPADYLKTSLALAHDEGLDRPLIGTGTFVDPTARLIRTVLWDEVVVERECELTECVIGDRVRVPSGCRFERRAIVAAESHHMAGSERVGDLLVVPLSTRGPDVRTEGTVLGL